MKGKIPHDSAVQMATGTAEFIDDRALLKNEVHVGLFFSQVPKGKIKSINFKKAQSIPGFLGLWTSKNLVHNRWGTIFQDQPLLAEETVAYAGEVILVYAADTLAAIGEIRKVIEVKIQSEEPTLGIDKAITEKNFIGSEREIRKGSPEEVFSKSPFKIEGVIEMAGQDHFYLESQACIAYPRENGTLEIHSSSQHPTEVQHVVAHALGLKYSDVVCIVKRMGGAFGGKESQASPFAAYAGLVALKTGRPARLILTKDDDMQITGKRNPFKNFYKVGFNESGKILSLIVKLFSDGGAYADLSTAIMERAMLHTDNAYYIPNVFITGQVVRTNTASNTAFRGFGGPKGVATIENIIEEIAAYLKKDSLEIRKINVYQKGNSTPYGQEITDDVLPRLFNELSGKSDYSSRRKEIELHNKKPLDTFRGLSMTAVKFGISFTTRFLNQGSALVNIHADGSIQVSTGATEMGQGVNTKIQQVVAEAFGIDESFVKVMATSTEKNPNTSPTAASSGSDINGWAAKNACETLKARLSAVAEAVLNRTNELRGRAVAGAGTAAEIQITEKLESEFKFINGMVIDSGNPDKKIEFSELIEEAYLNRISLSANGFFKYPHIYFDKTKGQGEPFYYFTNGVALSEVSINRWTGELKVLRSDLLMDLGRSINEGIDMGQVTGGFVQGMGWVTTENLFYDSGVLKTFSPSTYKIPNIQDIPRVFNCELLEGDSNEKNLKGSKAVGEPPLLLGISVWTATKDALRSHRNESVSLKIPATQEEIFRHFRESTNV